MRLLNVKRDHLDALVSEQDVRAALEAEQDVFVPSFGLWAVRQPATRRHNPKMREWLPPKTWTWRAFSPLGPQELPTPDQQALAHLASHLHGLTLVQWTLDDRHLRYTRWPLRAVQVGRRWTLQAQAPRLLPPIELPDAEGEDPYPLERWDSVPLEAQLATLAETIYIEQIEVAPLGAFTNIDLLAWRGETRLAIEVKVRRTDGEAGPEPLRLSGTQLETLLQLRDAGWNPHVVVRSTPVWARSPARVLAEGSWHACHAIALRSALGNVLEVLPTLPELTVTGLLAARAASLPSPPSQSGPGTCMKDPESVPQIKSGGRPETVRRDPVSPTVPTDIPTWSAQESIVAFENEFGFLHPARPAMVRLGGRVYPTPVAAFLAARTLDQDVRASLTGAGTLEDALTQGTGAAVRLDWPELRAEVVQALLRTSYPPGSSSARALTATLPAHLADERCEHPALSGLRGPDGLQALTEWRRQLAWLEVEDLPTACCRCARARKSSWPGLLGCTLAGGLAATRACTAAPVVRGPAFGDDGQVSYNSRLLPLTALGGRSFRAGPSVE